MEKRNSPVLLARSLAASKATREALAPLSTDNLLHLDDLSEQSIVASLASRFTEKNRVYTRAGTITLALNPYCWSPTLYSTDVMKRYRARATGSESGADPLPPHLYEAAASAHAAMERAAAGTRHTIVISGESGAGKTEATKIILTYLVAASGDLVDLDARAAILRERVLQANPLLEAFGNARTLRNDNSSRFGKLIEISFAGGSGSRIAGARIINYLLERTRISTPPRGERNFHILYQLLAASPRLPPALQQALPWKEPKDLTYLSSDPSGWGGAEVSAAVITFGNTSTCLDVIGVAAEAREQLWLILSAVLHLGNLTFATKKAAASGQGSPSVSGEGCAPNDEDASSTLAALLGVTPAALSTAICRRRLAVRNQNVVLKEQSIQQAHDSRDALARALYNGVFEWLVEQLNSTIRGGGEPCTAPTSEPRRSCVAVLDIYGFESLGTNSFEQLLINYANEKLQHLFNLHIFELEQKEYLREGIEWKEIEWVDNQPTLELIEGRPRGVPGILASLDDATWRTGGEEADTQMLQQLHTAFASKLGHPSYVRPKLHSATSFALVHYAGEVCYDVRGFSRKNFESLGPDVQELLAEATNPWLKANLHLVLGGFPEAAAAVPTTAAAEHVIRRSPSFARKRKGKLRQESVGEQFRTQLHELIEAIAAPESGALQDAAPYEERPARNSCAYVRCIKSNSERKPWVLDEASCTLQLRCAGMMEAVRIRKESFAYRLSIRDFLFRFTPLIRHPRSSSLNVPTEAGAEELAERSRLVADELAHTLGQPQALWQVGHTKVFLRQPLARSVERWAILYKHAMCRALQRAARAYMARSRGAAASTLQTGWRLGRAVVAGREHRIRARTSQRAFEYWAREAKRRAAEKVVAMRLAAEAAAAEAERLALERTEAERLAEAERLVAVRAEEEHAAAEKAYAEQPAAEAATACLPAILPLSMLPTGSLSAATAAGANAAAAPLPPAPAIGRTVGQLQPPKAVCVETTTTIVDAAQRMLDGRADALLVPRDSTAGGVSSVMRYGILTATDIARKVIAVGLDPRTCRAADVMTANPHVVTTSDPAANAFTLMTAHRFRHLPVDVPGGAPALLDMKRCLFDVLVLAERAQAAGEALLDAVSRGAGASNVDVLAPALRSLLAPSLGSLAVQPPAVIPYHATVRDAATALSLPGVTAVLVERGAAAVAADGVRYELLTPRTLLPSVISDAQLDAVVLGAATVSSVCTGEGPFITSADCSVIDALHSLQAERCSHVLLLDPSTQQPTCLLDVLQLVQASVAHVERSADAQQLHAFWGAAAALDESSAAHRPPGSVVATEDDEGSVIGSLGAFGSPVKWGRREREGDYDSMHIRPEDSISMVCGRSPLKSPDGRVAARPLAALPRRIVRAASFESPKSRRVGMLLIKLQDEQGHFYRVHCTPAEGWPPLQAALAAKLEGHVDDLRGIVYTDDDGDRIVVDSDEALLEAANHVLAKGLDRLQVTPVTGPIDLLSPTGKTVIAAGQPANARRVPPTEQPSTLDGNASVLPSPMRQRRLEEEKLSAVSAFLGGLVAASSLAVVSGLVLAAKAAKR